MVKSGFERKLMKIQNLILGDYQTNSFVLTAYESAQDCVIIDTGLQNESLLQYLTQNELNPVALILTHGHADHIAGINPLRQNYPDIKVVIHKLDAGMLTDSIANLSAMAGTFFKAEPADIVIETEQVLDFAGLSIQVLHTPGHTPGGISLYFELDSVVFSGDALFADSIGRTDFPGGDFDTLIKGIKGKLLTLPGKTKVYTGHGPETTIERELKHNQFLA
jgi:glyoxylase-like metal-dependent hydrolase (beta-lactamase superfamily II)